MVVEQKQYNQKEALEIGLLKEKNNVAKSKWKFLEFNIDEVRKYNEEFKLIREKQGMQKFGLVKNNLTINNINYMYTYFFYLGNSYLGRRFSH